VFAHYYAGPVLDDRVLLAGAFAGFTQELDQLGMDQPDATMPALTGNRDRDWDAFAAVYQEVTSQLPASPAQRQELAAATMTGMIASLDKSHARWSYPAPPSGDVTGDLGITTSPAPGVADIAPQEALPPLFLTAVLPGSPAASSGLRPGDIIVSPAEVSQLLGAFIHGAAWSYDCNVHGSCTANYTDSSVPLLHLPLVVLTDRNCASACDAFSGAVKDLRLGTLVGTRTEGILSGRAAPYLLDDASLLILPATQELSANHELINGIGVAPDYYIPLTAQDLSTGHDPDIAKALTLLGG
jgi:carboxyl-terminal processing protease